ncbi:hypothetical protein MWU65_13550 [Cellulophaga sp. F20128]|uniref:hypothetical protein n=1 Tax=Cellulophaga sp. F20128 TaxID=2926413 RepID=UPI001FF50EA9|nr:hypothetical protein [Cellulophaga sp. F20128]MCK0158214.1 hypothetical protein [Cellulophaga sp. F20128]
MKTLCIALFALASVATTTVSQDTETVTATYVGYEKEMYHFTAEDDTPLEFQDVSPEALKKHNLTKDETLKGKSFTISYKKVTTTDEATEKEMVSKSIVDLELLEE